MIEVKEHQAKPLTVFAMKRKIKKYNAAHTKDDMDTLERGERKVLWLGVAGYLAFLWWLV